MQDYRKLVVWQQVHPFVLDVYAATASFPDEERHGLTNQIRRSAVSIPSNIAEGCGRETNSELARFLYIAMGSASELDYQLLLAHDLKYLAPDRYQQLHEHLDHIRRMLNAFIQKLKTNNQ
jgi:four helix bundle protein